MVTTATAIPIPLYEDDSDALISKSTWPLKLSGLVFAGLLLIGRSASYGNVTWTPTYHPAASPLIVQTSLRMATAILTASGLSFLGLGPAPPTPEWGAMLSTGRKFITSHAELATYPGLAILLVTLAFNLLGDGLRDALDPRLRR